VTLSSLKTTIIGAIIAIGLILIAIFYNGLGGVVVPAVNNSSEQNTPQGIALTSTNPPELFEKKDMFITPTQILEFTFNTPLENGPETKIFLDPTHPVKIELSSDKKTAKITPEKPYKLDQGYTLVIKSETKFDGKKTLEKEYNFHFNTPSYSGI